MLTTKILNKSLILLLILIFFSLLSISIGTVNISISDIINTFINPSKVNEQIRNIIFDVRLPRIILAILVGAGLSLNGAVFQALLRNPLAEPYILGISGGSAFGALLSITLGFGIFGINLISLFGALIIVVLVFFISSRNGDIDPNYLILSGIVISAFLSSLILLLVSFNDQSFRTALFWLLGNLSMSNFDNVFFILPFFIFTCFIAFINAHKFNLLSISEENARQFGINTKNLKTLSYFSTSLLTSIIVSNVGIIGFVGFLVPHLCRLIFGNDNKILIPTSLISGAIFLLFSDLLSRVVLAPIEIPIGAVTAIVGSPLFIIVLKKKLYNKN